MRRSASSTKRSTSPGRAESSNSKGTSTSGMDSHYTASIWAGIQLVSLAVCLNVDGDTGPANWEDIKGAQFEKVRQWNRQSASKNTEYPDNRIPQELSISWRF